MMVSSLPSIAPFLSQLRQGSVKAFFSADQPLVTPVLRLLGVEGAAFFPPAQPPLAAPFHFCTPRLHFNLGTRPQYPRAQMVPSFLHDLRRELRPAYPRAQMVPSF